jgi:hypothetical protein
MRRLTGALLASILLATQAAGAESARPLTHPDHAAVPLNRAFLRAVFTMRVREWSDGAPIHVFVLSDGSRLHAAFSREALGTYPYVLRGIWDRLVFTGTGAAPTSVADEEQMRRRVRATPGAIGYVWQVDRGEGAPRVVPARKGGDSP